MKVEYRSSISVNEFAQIIELVDRYYAELANKKIDPNLPTKDIIRTSVKAEVSAYLDQMNKLNYGLPVFVVLVLDDAQAVIAFTLLTQSHTIAGACGINYCAVSEKHRNAGLARRMFDEIKLRFSSIGLSCRIAKVEIYERLDFKILGADGVLVAMRYGSKDDSPKMGVLRNYETPEVQAALDRLVDKYGPEKSRRIQKQIEKNQKEEGNRVKQFLRSRGIR